MNKFILYFKDGSSEQVEFPSDWSVQEILRQTGADDFMFVCEVSL